MTCGFDSIRILSYRVESPKNTGNSLGVSTRTMLVCDLLVCKMAVRKGSRGASNGHDLSTGTPQGRPWVSREAYRQSSPKRTHSWFTSICRDWLHCKEICRVKKNKKSSRSMWHGKVKEQDLTVDPRCPWRERGLQLRRVASLKL